MRIKLLLFCCALSSLATPASSKTRGKRSKESLAVEDYGNGGTLAPRMVAMKVYVRRDIWEATREEVDTDMKQFMVESLEKLFAIVNHHLSHLDNGGYFVQFDKTVHRLEKSDVKMGKTYTDRLDGNATKNFDQSDMFSHTFIFQEAVQEMKGRMDVDVRLLIIPRDILESKTKAAAEEHCVCEPHWFGCVIVLSIGDKLDWYRSANLLTHEFGHVLGATFHDDTFYPPDQAKELIMWSEVHPHPTVWSGKARTAIQEHDNTCMERKGNTKV